ncbi:hypothetical protein [Streptomyces sp. NPDC017991]|uniref:hypothetical protein n=1 Tax=Streptomyces sp. NPDC017991 TaxID=3365026 RepID=UPI0037AB4339
MTDQRVTAGPSSRRRERDGPLQLDQVHGPVLLDAEARPDKYRRLLDVVETMALPPEKSGDFVHGITRHL